jgi:hypothetical protein
MEIFRKIGRGESNTDFRCSMAHSELYLTLARVVRSYDFDLFDTIQDDVSIHNVRIVGYPKQVAERGEGQGEVKVTIRGKTGI